MKLRIKTISGTKRGAMFIRRFHLALITGCFIAGFCGCNKSETKPVEKAPTPPPALAVPVAKAEPIGRFHWLGSKKITADTNSTVADILRMPETAKLQAQTLEKLSLSPWGLQRGSATPTNVPSAALKAVLEDVLAEESFVEIRNDPGQPVEVAMAIRLSPERTELWRTNLAAVFESLTGAKPVNTAEGWSFAQTNPVKTIQFIHRGEWTFVGITPGTNSTMAEMVAQIPQRPATTNAWLEIDMDPSRVASALGLKLPTNCPHVAVVVNGEAKETRMRAKLDFPQPLRLEQLPAWTFPTNLIHDPLISFTAIRGLSSWVKSQNWWTNLSLGEPPNQVFAWALNGLPVQTFLAMPDPEASNHLAALAISLKTRSHDFFSTNAFGSLEGKQGALNWIDFPFLAPSIRAMQFPEGNFLAAGWSEISPLGRKIPHELLAQFMPTTNLVYYNWEITDSRIAAWIYLSQSIRLLSHLAQMPPKSVSVEWLQAVAPKLGNCATVATVSGPSELLVVRNSSCGFNALELQLLSDWLESPDFPFGLHSLNAEVDQRIYRAFSVPASQTNRIKAPTQ